MLSFPAYAARRVLLPRVTLHHSEIVGFRWGVADLIRDSFKRGKYQDVILPLTVLRRLDCVLAGKQEQVLAKQAQLKGKGLEDPDAQLRRVSGFAFYNTSRYDFDKMLGDAPQLPRPDVRLPDFKSAVR